MKNLQETVVERHVVRVREERPDDTRPNRLERLVTTRHVTAIAVPQANRPETDTVDRH